MLPLQWQAAGDREHLRQIHGRGVGVLGPVDRIAGAERDSSIAWRAGQDRRTEPGLAEAGITPNAAARPVRGAPLSRQTGHLKVLSAHMKAVTKSLAMILAALAWSNLAYTCEIHRAARQGHVETVKEMLVADPGLAKQQCLDIGDFWLNGTPLHWASSSGQKEVVEYLLAHEVDVDAKAVNTLYTPLHSAAGFGRRDVAELLLAGKAAVDSRDKDRNTPLHLAAGNWPTEVVELLLANRPKIYEKDKEGKMQLQVMQAWDARAVIELLLANRAEVDATNKLGRTPLHMAAEFGNKGVIELLLSHKADVDAKDRKGKTPLHVALDAQEKIGETEMPLKKERLQALSETVDFLRSRGAKR